MDWVYLDGDQMGYQFNKGSNGLRLLKRRPHNCNCTDEDVVTYRGTQFAVILDRVVGNAIIWEGTGPHVCDPPAR